MALGRNKIQTNYYQIHTKENIDLYKIFDGGQIFSWGKYSEGYRGLWAKFPFL